jgi:hypothetical protein
VYLSHYVRSESFAPGGSRAANKQDQSNNLQAGSGPIQNIGVNDEAVEEQKSAGDERHEQKCRSRSSKRFPTPDSEWKTAAALARKHKQ